MNFVHNFPTVDKGLLTSMKNLFIKRNVELLGSFSPNAVQECLDASSVDDFLRAHYPFAGYASLDDYFEENNPMEVVNNVVRPVLILNSEDDVVCLKENIRDDVVRSLGGGLLLRTSRGSHIAFNEGLLGTGSYMHRVSMDFLESARVMDLELKNKKEF
jgi:predicted alpha/beta-fold hydrolase